MGTKALLVTGGRVAGAPVAVGAPAWFEWLGAVASFRYEGEAGSFTARRERAGSGRGGEYWKAYRRVDGVLRRVYLGVPGELTLQRLEEAAARLAGDGAGLAGAPAVPAGATVAAGASAVTTAGALSAAAGAGPGLLATKLTAPLAAANLVGRPALASRVHEGMNRKLTVLSAPPGFGKTTLLAEWHAGPGRAVPLAWLSLDAGDNDPVRFWTYVIAAVQSVAPGAGAEAAAWLRSPQPPALSAVLTAVLNDLARFPNAIALVLDDYHVITAEAIHQGLAFFLDHLPPRAHLFMTTRADPPLPLARWRARGDLQELRAPDLRFTAAEAGALLNELMDLGLSAADVAVLEGRTEGWVAGLKLAGLSLQGRPERSAFIQAFAGNERYIVDYLVEEVLAHQPPDMRQFLLETAVLERLSAELCEAVTGRPGGRAMLEALQRANLFLVPLDAEGCWYRYHHLFAAVLAHRARREQPDAVPELHRRAARWLGGQGLVHEAVGHALSADDSALALALIEPVAQRMLFSGERETLNGWLERLPPGALAERPALALMHAWAFVFTGQVGEEGLEAAGERACALTVPEPLQGEVAHYRAFWALFRGDGPGALAAAEEALRLLRPDQAGMRAGSLVVRGGALVLLGKLQQAEGALREALIACQAPALLFPRCLTLNQMGVLAYMQGQLHEAEALHRRVLREVGGRPVFQRAEAGFRLGELLRVRNRLDEAEQELQTALALAEETGQAIYAGPGYVALARVLGARGDRQGATSFLDRAAEAYRRRGHLTGPAEVEAERARLSAALTADDATPAGGVSVRELEVLELLAQGLSNKALAGALFLSEGTVKVHLKHIYSKLGAGSRTEAVARARELGLLP